MPKTSSPRPQLSPDKSRVSPNDLKRRSIHDKKKKSPQSDKHRYQESERENDDVDYAAEASNIYPILDELLESEDEDDRIQWKKYTSGNKMTEHMSNNIYPDINADEKSTYFSWVKKFLILLSVIIMVLIGSFFKPSEKPNVRSSEIDVKQLMQNLKSRFENQPLITFKIIKPALARVLNINSEPSAPAVITLLAEREAEDTAREFALHIANEIIPEKYIFINEAVYKNRNANEIKLEIDKKIKSGVQNDSCNVIVVDKFQKIPFQSAMIFHNYCDHDTALFKRAVYLLLLTVDKIILENVSSRHLDEIAMNQMRTIWHEAHRDQIDSLITRITVNVVYIKNK